MLAYAASRPTAGNRQSSPNALLFIISAHVAVAAVVMSMKMDLPIHIREKPIPIIDLPTPVDPDPLPQPPKTHHAPAPIPTPTPLPPIPIPRDPTIDRGPTDTGGTMTGGDTGGPGAGPMIGEPIKLSPVRHDPRLLTPPAELKPPYPASKLLTEEEAVLTLRLSIDERGRVVAVEPIGRADRDFLQAARQHLIAHWRDQPAMEGERTVSSYLTITLHFMLDG